ncbi:DNA-directed RNA polymerase subunit alpha [Chlamydiales bacterium SCGC AG-110-P3]|nr:DNA-directed RNA polymerase subunit alpha [Chlamydiales bacterium SCGC AG-110-P3]
MSVKYGKFEMPETITFDQESTDSTFTRFVAEPFERGFGHTVGNSMRRMLLSSLEAPAIISISIEGVSHEYTAVEGVIEDMTNIILNVKGGLLRKLPRGDDPLGREPRSITAIVEVTQDDLDAANGQVSVTLADVVKDDIFEVVNPELHLFSVTAPLKRQVDLRVAMGRGYVPAERIEVSDRGAHEILIDALFSPVRNVNYFVENTRVGQDTDFDKLVLEVTTDGRITPQEALNFAAQILRKHFDVFDHIEVEELAFDEGFDEDAGEYDEVMDKLVLRVDEIELSVRSTNCLAGANIETIAELVSIPERRMLEFRNFGKKSLNEIKAKLLDMGLGLGMDVTRYGLDAENIREQIAAYVEERKVTRPANGVAVTEEALPG